jgi:hypothetical protein
LIGKQDAFVAAYNVTDGSHVWSQNFGGTGSQCNTVTIAADMSRLAMGVSYDGPLTIGSNALTTSGTDVALARLNPTTGLPSATVSTFADTAPGAGNFVSLSIVYTDDRLAGAGAFFDMASLLGTNLLSAGEQDVASFRVDF